MAWGGVEILGCCNNGYYGGFWDASGNYYGFVWFNNTLAGGEDYENFFPCAMSGCGDSIGSEYNTGGSPNLFMSRTGVLTTTGSDDSLIALNNQGQVIGTYNSTGEGFIWQSGTHTTLSSLIPGDYQGELSSIYPRLISNPDSNGVINILFDANFTDPVSGTTSYYNTYVLSGSAASLSSTTTTLSQIQLADGEPTSDIQCINANGVLGLINSCNSSNAMASNAMATNAQMDNTAAQSSAATTSAPAASAAEPPPFQLRDNSNLVSGTNAPWDSTGVPVNGTDTTPWTAVVVGATNSYVRLVSQKTADVEIDIAPGYQNNISFPNGTTVAVTGTSTNFDIIGKAGDHGDIIFKQISTGKTLATLHVDVLPKQTVPIDIFRVVDSNNLSKTTMPPPGSPEGPYGVDTITDSQIVDDLNENFPAQAGITFTLGQSGTLSPACWSDTNGNLANSSFNSSPIQTIIAAAPNNHHLKMFIVKNISSSTSNGDMIGFTFEGVGPCFVDYNAPSLDFNHEVGHALSLATENYDGKYHDKGPWPIEFKTDGDCQPQQGLMYPIDTNINEWIRKADWDKANATAAQQYK